MSSPNQDPEANSQSRRVDPSCPFCALSDEACVLIDGEVRAFRHQQPLSPGHVLIATRRHVASWFDATPSEQQAMLSLATRYKAMLEALQTASGYSLVVNVGQVSGQTTDHVLLHFIPRHKDDGLRRDLQLATSTSLSAAMVPQARDLPHGDALIRGGDDPLLPHLVAHVAGAIRVDIAVAFTMVSGVRLLEEHLRDVIARGGRVRLLTGDYLDCTEPEALLRLLDIGHGSELRFFQGMGKSFHLKSYICYDEDGRGTAFVGSSNLSHTALQDGIEWNYRVITSRDAVGFEAVRRAFADLFAHPRTVALDPKVIAAYQKRRRVERASEVAVPLETPLNVPEPHVIQQEALLALDATRQKGDTAGLVVLATGLGKTWLSAFDTVRAGARRVLFVAHRDEILDQAIRTFRAIRPTAVFGKFVGTEKALGADVTFASVQTLSRRAHLDKFPSDAFDYIVVDEFHHASATTYRRLLDHFAPQFLLGLTATPERTDGGDLLALCGENVVYRCDLVDGIRRGLLAPFDYYGVPDEVDYSNIPWRNGRFDESELTARLAVEGRADNALDQLTRRGGSRTLAFCVSQRHADFMKQYFAAAGRRVASVHAGASSDPRTRSLERLQSGDLELIFAVDMFNEGVDLPDVDTILMLRPTESPVLWLQQFGRGLRYRYGKRLKVIDYIGNHRSFLLKPQALFELDGSAANTAYALRLVDEGRASELLPPGCTVTYDLEAKDILKTLLQRDMDRPQALMSYYADFRERNGVRPTATEAFHDGYDPRATRQGFGSWLQFVRTMGDLDRNQDAAEAELRSFLQSLEVTPLTRSFKMVTLLAMLAENAFPGPINIDRLAARVKTMAHRSAALRTEMGESLNDDQSLVDFLEGNPIASWVGGKGTAGEKYFTYVNRQFLAALPLTSALNEVGTVLVREIAEWRLAQYIRRRGELDGAPRITCRVSRVGVEPILLLPSRDRVAGVPEGWVEVLVSGEECLANFAKTGVNVMHRKDSAKNVMGDMLREWFGPGAGLPGVSQAVTFTRSESGYMLSPERGDSEASPRLWKVYKRVDVPKLFGFEFKGFEAQSGVVERPGITLLFVTLDKSGSPEELKFDDKFVNPSVFQWQSQNRTTRKSDAGRRIAEHRGLKIAVHLFVRATKRLRGAAQGFTYIGPLDFISWDGEKPITVQWRLSEPVPMGLRETLRVPPTT